MDPEKIDLMLRMLPDGVSRRDFLRTSGGMAASLLCAWGLEA